MSAREHVSAFQLDALAMGAVAEPERRSIEAHLAACDRCRARAAAGRDDRVRFERFVFPRTVDAVRGSRPAPWVRLAWLLAPALALITVLIGVGVKGRHAGSLTTIEPATPMAEAPARPLDVRLRAFALAPSVDRAPPTQVRELEDGASVRPGELVRFRVQAARLGWVALIVADARGRVTIVEPPAGDASVPIAVDHPVELPTSLLVEPGMLPARAFAFYSVAPLPSLALRRAVEQLHLDAARLRASDRAPVPAVLDGQRVEIAAQRSLLFEGTP
jgi:hypothetical protein